MVKSFFMDINVVACEIIRASDGLALSSRNAYLSENELCLALKFHAHLNTQNR